MALHSHQGKLSSKDNQKQRLGSGVFGISNVKDATVNTGQGRVYIKDGAIIVNDGTNDRILIGFSANGF